MIGPTDLLHPSPAPHFKTFQAFLICCPERPSFNTIGNKLARGITSHYPVFGLRPSSNFFKNRTFR